MSLLSECYLPPPNSWDAFEGLVFDLFTERMRTFQLKRYGRSGQVQKGVDIAGPTDLGFIGVQCKNHPAGNISTDAIDKEIAKAEEFTPPLSHYVVATSARRDAGITEYIFTLSKQREEGKKFTVEIFFWEDLAHDITRSPKLLQTHYPQLLGIEPKGKLSEVEKRQVLIEHFLPFVVSIQQHWEKDKRRDGILDFLHKSSHLNRGQERPRL